MRKSSTEASYDEEANVFLFVLFVVKSAVNPHYKTDNSRADEDGRCESLCLPSSRILQPLLGSL